MLKKLFKKKKYLNCPYMQHSIHFFYDEVKACCSNIPGFMFYPKYEGEGIDWDFVYKKRKKAINKINNFFVREEIPKSCQGCCKAPSFLQDKPIKNVQNMIDTLYFHNHMACNADCTYCTYVYYKKGYKYKVLPLVKSLIEKDILSPLTNVYMSGGEITISPEFEELLSILYRHRCEVEILTNGIRYSKSIEEAFKKDKCHIIISLDSANAETYKKIKRVDCFDKVIENIKNYIKATDNARENITLKYIIVDGVNDNKEEITSFVELVKNIGIKHIRLDFDYEKYKFERDTRVPQYYFELFDVFNKVAEDNGLTVLSMEQITGILERSR